MAAPTGDQALASLRIIILFALSTLYVTDSGVSPSIISNNMFSNFTLTGSLTGVSYSGVSSMDEAITPSLSSSHLSLFTPNPPSSFEQTTTRSHWIVYPTSTLLVSPSLVSLPLLPSLSSSLLPSPSLVSLPLLPSLSSSLLPSPSSPLPASLPLSTSPSLSASLSTSPSLSASLSSSTSTSSSMSPSSSSTSPSSSTTSSPSSSPSPSTSLSSKTLPSSSPSQSPSPSQLLPTSTIIVIGSCTGGAAIIVIIILIVIVACCVKCWRKRRRRRRVYLMPLYNFDADFEDEDTANNDEMFLDDSDTVQMLNNPFRSREMEPVLEFEAEEVTEE